MKKVSFRARPTAESRNLWGCKERGSLSRPLPLSLTLSLTLSLSSIGYVRGAWRLAIQRFDKLCEQRRGWNAGILGVGPAPVV